MSDANERLQRALELAYRYLNRRDRTVGEVRVYLQRQAIAAATIEAAIDVLLDEGSLDDARYAQLFAEDKRELEQWGADRIRRTLLERGIECELVDEILTRSVAENENELDRALSVLRRRFPSPPRERRDRDRALGVLLRKGYDSEVALDALSAYSREAGEPSFP